MNDIKFTSDELETKSIEELRKIALELGLKFSGNTGEETLRTRIADSVKSEKEKEVKSTSEPTKEDLREMDHMDPKYSKEMVRKIVKAKALHLKRVKIVNLDSSESSVSGGIFTVYNQFTGKVSKYIPFDNEYHVPQILLDYLKDKKFPLRKKKTKSKFGVPEYTTTMVKKYNIEYLEPLTKEELKALAAKQTGVN